MMTRILFRNLLSLKLNYFQVKGVEEKFQFSVEIYHIIQWSVILWNIIGGIFLGDLSASKLNRIKVKEIVNGIGMLHAT